MKKTNKKGFTIVELVIVIAVIAILAAVLIPTFISLTKKANQSADIQAVSQMNKQLAIANAETPITNVADAVRALGKVNIDLENYKPMATDHYFYFVVDTNGTPMVVYTDAEDNVIYPEGVSIDGCQLMSLSGAVPTDGNYTISGNSVTISNGAQLVAFMEAYAKGNTAEKSVSEIKLDGNIDLKGAVINFGTVSNLTFDGCNHTLSGFRADKNAVTGTWAGATKTYGYALFGDVPTGVTVTVKNLTISDAVISNTADNTAFGHSGILFGTVNGTVNIESVNIRDCTVIGGDKVGSLIGQLQSNGNATIKNVAVSNTKLLGLGWIAKAVGYVDKSASVSFSGNNSFESVIVGINDTQWSSLWNGNDKNWKTNELPKPGDVKKYEIDTAYSYNKSNTYLPYYQKTDTNNLYHYEGMCTENLYWLADWHKTNDSVSNQNAKVPTSSDDNYSGN